MIGKAQHGKIIELRRIAHKGVDCALDRAQRLFRRQIGIFIQCRKRPGYAEQLFRPVVCLRRVYP